MNQRITPSSRLSAALAFAAACTLTACGGSSADDTTTPTDQAATPVAEDHKGEHGDHAKLTPELDAFHDTLAPRWHAAPGPERKKDTCTAVPEFKTRASAVASATAPTNVDATRWSESGAALTASVTSLETACAGSDDKAFDTAFTAVHERFHAAMELVVGPHEQGEHGDPGKHDHGKQ